MFKFLTTLFVILICTLAYSIDTSVKEPIQRQDPFTGTAIAVPGVIQAENYDEGGEQVAFGIIPGKVNNSAAYRFEGVNIMPSEDIGGGYYVSGIQKGDWMEYTISVPETGHYQVSARMASGEETAFSLAINGKNNLEPQGFLSTGKAWKTVDVPWVHLPAGTHVLRFSAEQGAFDLNWISITKAGQSPYGGTPWEPVGSNFNLEAEKYDNGGQYISYYDTTPGNICYYKAFRYQDVDVENNPVNPSTTNVGWIATNEWLEYTINIPATGWYRINVAASTPTGGKVKIELSGLVNTTRNLVYHTSTNQTYIIYGIGQFYLTQGLKVLRVTMLQDLWNLNYIQIAEIPDPTAAVKNNPDDYSRSPKKGEELK